MFFIPNRVFKALKKKIEEFNQPSILVNHLFLDLLKSGLVEV